MKKFVSLILVLIILGGCTAKETTSLLILQDAITFFEEKGVKLVEVEMDDDYAFSKALIGIKPTFFRVNENHIISIYVFNSPEDVANGIAEFEDKTATAALTPYEKYAVNNVLIFYIPEGGTNDPHISDTLKKMQANY